MVQKVRAATTVVSSATAPVSAHDEKIAKGLQASIVQSLKTVRFGQPLPKASSPVFKSGHWQTPGGARLVPVVLQRPPAGSADLPTTTALVNPKTNEFYHLEAGGLTGASFFHGPLALSPKFTGTSFSAAACKELEALANHTAAPQQAIAKLPTNILGPNGNAHLTGALFVDAMPGPSSGARKAVATIELSGNGFNDAPPKYQVTKLEVYEQGTNTLVASVTNPKATDAGARPRGSTFQDFRAQVPVSKLDLSKKYAVVLTVGINGAPAQRVRSDFMRVGTAQ
jgi:hypothetical protein